jgi:diacylglycerol kinase (ATP)
MSKLPKGQLGIIINPAAGRGKGAAALERLLPDIQSAWAGEARLYRTTGPGDGTHQAEKAIAEGAVILAAAGGDGTLFEVIQAAAPKQIPVLSLPNGTGNDLVRTLGISSLEHAASLLQSGKVMRIDAGLLEGKRFVNILSCGFDAEVGDKINKKYRHLKGTAAYLAGVVSTLFSYKALPLTLEIDGTKIERKVMLCAVANAQTYGGGMKVSPHSVVNDGLLEVILVGEVSRFEFLKTFPKVFSGSHLSHPAISTYQGRRIKITSEKELAVGLDGDVIHRSEIEIIIDPLSVPIVVP